MRDLKILYFISVAVFLLFTKNLAAYELITDTKKISNKKISRAIYLNVQNDAKANQIKYFRNNNQCSSNKSISSTVIRISQTYAVDPYFIDAIISVESCYKPNAISSKGAVGLMQLMPVTAKRFGVRDRYNPEQNITGGVKYIKYLFDRYNGDLTLITAAYNAGEGAVDTYSGIPPYNETINYVEKVLGKYQKGSNLKKLVIKVSKNNECFVSENIKSHTYLKITKNYMRRISFLTKNESIKDVSSKLGLGLERVLLLNKKNKKMKNQIIVWECKYTN